jgi:hypothetical protein
MKSFVARDEGKGKGKAREESRIPPEAFKEPLEKLVSRLRKVLMRGDEVKKAALDEVASVVLGVGLFSSVLRERKKS